MQKINLSKAELKWWLSTISDSFFFILGLYLLLATLLLFNYEEMEMVFLLKTLLFALPILFYRTYPCFVVKIDMERKAIVYRRRLGRRREIPFDRISGFTLHESWETINVYMDMKDKLVSVKKQPGYLELLEWLKVKKPVVEAEGCSSGFSWWGTIWLVIIIALSVFGGLYYRECDGFFRAQFPFKAGETVEVSGVYKEGHGKQRKRDYGPNGFMSFELKEYPGIRFNASTHLPDEVFLLEQGKSLTDSTVYLSVSKSDYETIQRHWFLRGFRESVRTYEVRTAHQILLKKDLGLGQ
ncbi:MAG: hypothetical protein IPN76_18385 [Saprospiraceae bacterium]|nr:hypothetical protein [Saprospiraceae bacterium]